MIEECRIEGRRKEERREEIKKAKEIWKEEIFVDRELFFLSNPLYISVFSISKSVIEILYNAA
jgi:hypothetical protein